MKKRLAWMLALCVAFLMLAPTAKAAGADCALTIRFPYKGAEFSLYHVAEVRGSDYVKTARFRAVPVDLEDRSDPAVLAETLAAYAAWMNIPADRVETVDESRTVRFEGLAPGLYLVTAGTVTVNGVEYTAAPVLVLLRGDDMINSKPGPVPPVGGDELISRKVLKIWNDGNSPERPDSVTVYLLCDGKPVETVKLSDKNNWSWRWDDLDADRRWTVAEEPVGGYSTQIEKKGITFVITNTAYADDPGPGGDPTPGPGGDPTPGPGGDPTPGPGGDPTPGPGGDPTPGPGDDPTPGPGDRPADDTGEEPDVPKLPQTGLLWWPVPVLACCGMILFTAGWWKSRREEDE